MGNNSTKNYDPEFKAKVVLEAPKYVQVQNVSIASEAPNYSSSPH